MAVVEAHGDQRNALVGTEDIQVEEDMAGQDIEPDESFAVDDNAEVVHERAEAHVVDRWGAAERYGVASIAREQTAWRLGCDMGSDRPVALCTVAGLESLTLLEEVGVR